MTRGKYLPAEARRAATVEAVVALAATRNPGDITTAAIARHMGLTEGALFRHFPNKDAILDAVMRWVAERLLARIDAASSAAAGPVAALGAIFHAHIDFIATHPGVPRMMFGELQRAGRTPTKRLVQVLLRAYGQRLSRVIDAGKTQGVIPAALETDAAIILFIGSIQGLVMQSLINGDVTGLRREAPRILALYLQGIGASP